MHKHPKPKINHIALPSKNLVESETFYSHILGFELLQYQLDLKGQKRSLWYQCENNILLMIELAVSLPSKEPVLAFTIEATQKEFWIKKLSDAGVVISAQSEYSIYFADPSGNRLALSHYSNSAK